jgi:signal transduction histidine kinase
MIATLLENARNRRPDTPVTVDARREKDFALIEVCDQAGPVADDDRAAAFERFSPLEPPGGRTTGLELYKVRRLAELQGGRVWLENGTSGEVRFGFALPLARGGGKG